MFMYGRGSPLYCFFYFNPFAWGCYFPSLCLTTAMCSLLIGLAITVVLYQRGLAVIIPKNRRRSNPACSTFKHAQAHRELPARRTDASDVTRSVYCGKRLHGYCRYTAGSIGAAYRISFPGAALKRFVSSRMHSERIRFDQNRQYCGRFNSLSKKINARVLCACATFDTPLRFYE